MNKKIFPHIVIFVAGGMFTGGMAFMVQGRAFGFDNVPLAAVVPAFFVGAISATVIAFLIRRNRNILLERLAVEQEISSELKTENAQRRLIEQTLRESEDRFRTLAGVAPVGIFETDADGECIHVNQKWCDIAGMPEEAALGGGWASAIHPDDREMVWEAWGTAAERQKHFSQEYRFQQPDGTVSSVLGQATAKKDQEGRVIGHVGTITDITQHKEIELQLQQALKMEAVGQLTGGVAHDFNNLLAVIIGNSELLKDQLGQQDSSLNAIFRAARRGAELTDRLLAFSRQKPLSPESIDTGSLVSGMSELLRRTLGETIDIEISAAPELWNVWADPGQMENALLNLALNARDAMPDGGRLHIECFNSRLDADGAPGGAEVVAGDYAVVAVNDNGCGMSPGVKARAFEPFFTTKEVGQGSGLGLSMVYGFATQSGGQLTIYSEEGHGTSVKLYLPRAPHAAKARDIGQAADIPKGRGELVLVIEDDPDVRDVVVQMLKGLGYGAVEVPDAAAARLKLASGTQIDLVLSDVVLPGGISGPDFAQEARITHPGLKIIFMSGYPAVAARHNGLFGPDQVLLNKPFEREKLAEALHEALN